MKVLEKPTTDKFMISCVFFKDSDLAKKNDGTLSINCGSCIIWNGVRCRHEPVVIKYYKAIGKKANQTYKLLPRWLRLLLKRMFDM